MMPIMHITVSVGVQREGGPAVFLQLQNDAGVDVAIVALSADQALTLAHDLVVEVEDMRSCPAEEAAL